MKKFLITLLFIANVVFAQKLPTIEKPKELAGGTYQEGTITKISSERIGDFYIWARSAKRVLGNALEDISRMKLSEKVSYLKTEMKSVIDKSGRKNYQSLMRYALNRGMLYSNLIASEGDLNVEGTTENQLDLLRGAIKIALNFYESDLDFQKRLEKGESTVEINQAEFGISLAKEMYLRAMNVQDTSAQYRVQYKILEVLTWDLVQDRDARDYSETILELYEGLERMDETPSENGALALAQIRKLNFIYSRATKYLNGDY